MPFALVVRENKALAVEELEVGHSVIFPESIEHRSEFVLSSHFHLVT